MIAVLPDLPTVAETVPGFEYPIWIGLMMPAATPRPIIDRMHREVASAMADPALRARFAELGAEPLAATPDDTARHIAAETAKTRPAPPGPVTSWRQRNASSCARCR